MKKIVLTALFGLTALSGFSQVTWDVKAGMSLSNFTQMDGGAKIGYSVGVGMDYAFNETWSLQSGVNFTSKGTKESDYDDGMKEEAKIFSHYIDIPVLAAFKMPIKDNIKLVVNAGPYFSAGLGGKYDYNFEGYGIESKSGKEDLFTKANGQEKAMMKRFDMGLQYGVGTEINEHFLVNLTGQCGFLSPFNEPYKTVFSDDGKSPKNLSFIISVGYRF